MRQPEILVIGGGTGIYPVVSALKQLSVKITTIIAVSDSGGSTGRIRDEFGFPPVGDLRQSLAALASLDSQRAIQELLLYRFERGSGLKGHNLGNLILTALQDKYRSTTKALEVAQQIFRIEGNVIPSTDTAVNLKITYQDGTEVLGEHHLDKAIKKPNKIAKVSLTPKCKVNPAVTKALSKADLIIIGPGDLYASLIAVLVTPGLSQALVHSKSPICYFLNLMTRQAQTHDMTATDHVTAIERILGFPLTKIIINTDPIPPEILTVYAAQQEFPVTDDVTNDDRILRKPLLEKTIHKQSSSDSVQRTLLRHSSKKIIPVIKSLLAI
ncbi:MAG: YvcK family protein [Candidatus Pacebacteria bacterium]|nr:YvcK family protein [Candidatus Paceibacterota bacterium]PIR60701.1 MAG: hypothetical protein COU67_01065 [Candidatus Pacebacteria bacterium CG10_big_fil_rev_8_21_14_0_10_44_54]